MCFGAVISKNPHFVPKKTSMVWVIQKLLFATRWCMLYLSHTSDFTWSQACIVDLGVEIFPIWRGWGQTPKNKLSMV